MKYCLGTDIGGTNIKTAVLDENNNILFFKSERSIRGKVCETAARMLTEAVNTLGLDASDIISAGLGIPGMIKGNKGPVLYTPNTGLSGVDIIKEITCLLERSGLFIPDNIFFTGNDADCAGVAEACLGAGRSYESMLLLSLGTGVGGSFIYKGKPVTFGGYSPEFGHFHFSDEGPLCPCGIKGCFEQYANSAAFKRLGFEKYTDALSQGLAGMTNVLRPDIIVLAGGVINEGPRLFEAVDQKLKTYIYAAELTGVPRVIPAALGQEAGAAGAALFAKICLS